MPAVLGPASNFQYGKARHQEKRHERATAARLHPVARSRTDNNQPLGREDSWPGQHFDAGQPAANDPVDKVSCRPDFAILAYPVITMGAKTHGGSRANLIGKQPDEEIVEFYSNEKQVTAMWKRYREQADEIGARRQARP